jgi:beta-lactamase class D
MKAPSLLLFLLFVMHEVFGSQTTFIAIDPYTDRVVASIGPSIDQRLSPCSTFKIALSAIGYDLGILHDEHSPVWPYDGSKVSLESHRAAHSPTTWMSMSVVWYSKLLATTIGRDSLQRYVSLLSYGNQDISGEVDRENGFASAHLVSSLKISPKEQVAFVKKLVCNQLPVSPRAMEMTKNLLFNQVFDNGWKLFGKTGTGCEKDGKGTISWYVGWIEKDVHRYIFALLVQDIHSFPTKEKRQETVKKLFHEFSIITRLCHE